MLKMNKNDKKDSNAPVELESQFILRLPPEPARILREAISTGSVHLKDRLTIKLDYDMRYGEVRVDHWIMHAKVVDLPTIVESLKTIDNKSFYKTADICQMLICKEEDDQTTTDEESPAKVKKKDPNKVDKKFLWPHGITPPMKNVRRRRFRKTLKKKYVEAPEIEKEVKRLLRVDNDAAHVKWEVICEEDERKLAGSGIKNEPVTSGVSGVGIGVGGSASSNGVGNNQRGNLTPTSSTGGGTRQMDVAEHDIFGEAVSDSEDEDGNINIMELEEESRASADDSRLSDSASLHGSGIEKPLVTQFSRDMFITSPSVVTNTSFSNKTSNIKLEPHSDNIPQSLTTQTSTTSNNFLIQGIKEEPSIKIKSEHSNSSPLEFSYEVMSANELPSASSSTPMQQQQHHHHQQSTSSLDDEYVENPLTKAEVITRMQLISQQLNLLNKRRQQKELEITNIENQTLRQRFQDILDNLISEQIDKQQEYEDLSQILQQYE